MSHEEAIGAASLDQRVVLLAVAEAADRGETPVNQVEVRGVCNDRLVGEGGPVVGRLAEADVARALNVLEAEDLVENVAEEASPVGKGRPEYEPVPATEAIRDALAGDDDLAPVVETLADT